MFILHAHSKVDKKLHISGPDCLDIFVDYDDVDQKQTLKNAIKVVKILNKNWNIEGNF